MPDPIEVDTYSVSPSGKSIIPKDILEIVDYPFDWGPFLDYIGDGIKEVDAFGDEGVTIEAIERAGDKVSVFAGGGTAGKTCRLACVVKTLGGRTFIRSIYLKIAPQ